MRFLQEVDVLQTNLIHLNIMRGQNAAICLIPLFSSCRGRLIDVGTQLDTLCALRGKGHQDDCHYTVAENPSSIIMKGQIAAAPVSDTEFQATFREQGNRIIIVNG